MRDFQRGEEGGRGRRAEGKVCLVIFFYLCFFIHLFVISFYHRWCGYPIYVILQVFIYSHKNAAGIWSRRRDSNQNPLATRVWNADQHTCPCCMLLVWRSFVREKQSLWLMIISKSSPVTLRRISEGLWGAAKNLQRWNFTKYSPYRNRQEDMSWWLVCRGYCVIWKK